MPSSDPVDLLSLEHASFRIVRRGFDASEVRGLLTRAAAEIAELRRAGDELRARLAEATEALSGSGHGLLEAQRVAAALGVEASQVIEAAHVAATERAERAEREAAAVAEEASAAADQLRDEAAAEADALRAEGAAQRDELVAEAEREAARILKDARRQGRDMVQEAQTVRERMLRDLSRKRHSGRAQVEQLRAGRDRLLESLSTVQENLDSALGDLVASVPEARKAAEWAGLRISEQPEPTPSELEAEIETARLVDLPLAEPGDGPYDHESDDEIADLDVLADDDPVDDDSVVAADGVAGHADDAGNGSVDGGRHSSDDSSGEAEPASQDADDAVEGDDSAAGGRLAESGEADAVSADGEAVTDAASDLDAVLSGGGDALPDSTETAEPEESGPASGDGSSSELAASDPAEPALAAGSIDEAGPAVGERPAVADSGDDIFAKLRSAEAEAASATKRKAAKTAKPKAAKPKPKRSAARRPAGSPTQAEGAADPAEPAEPSAAEQADQPDASRSSPGGPELQTAPDRPGPEAEAARQESVESATRALKKVLVDEQSSLLHRIRSKGPEAVSELLDSPERHSAYHDVLAGELRELAATLAAPDSLDLSEAAGQFDELALAPLDHRLRELLDSGAEPDELASAVRSLYRETRSRRIAAAAEAAVDAARQTAVSAKAEGR